MDFSTPKSKTAQNFITQYVLDVSSNFFVSELIPSLVEMLHTFQNSLQEHEQNQFHVGRKGLSLTPKAALCGFSAQFI